MGCTADAESEILSAKNLQLSKVLSQAWSRSEYSLACLCPLPGILTLFFINYICCAQNRVSVGQPVLFNWGCGCHLFLPGTSQWSWQQSSFLRQGSNSSCFAPRCDHYDLMVDRALSRLNQTLSECAACQRLAQGMGPSQILPSLIPQWHASCEQRGPWPFLWCWHSSRMCTTG